MGTCSDAVGTFSTAESRMKTNGRQMEGRHRKCIRKAAGGHERADGAEKSPVEGLQRSEHSCQGQMYYTLYSRHIVQMYYTLYSRHIGQKLYRLYIQVQVQG